MSDQEVKPVAPKTTPHSRPRSALRTTVTSQEIKGMRSIRRLGRDTWERLSEAQRIALARARRLFPQPHDAE
ncbi:MAG: hypothetical protein CVU38_14740 [Chloroflexi bacterium HGW-Chloroflexi-1]|nr:MAG: hypothetical protein CVU38_14740 [Chloroflexi bacterium HGW-Chloroflexi-1]